jgi:hypothetical protein
VTRTLGIYRATEVEWQWAEFPRSDTAVSVAQTRQHVQYPAGIVHGPRQTEKNPG